MSLTLFSGFFFTITFGPGLAGLEDKIDGTDRKFTALAGLY